MDEIIAVEQIEKQEQVKEIGITVNTLVEKAKELDICDASTNEYGIGLLSKIAEGKKKAEALRKLFTDPLNQSLKAINGFFKNLTAPLDEADTIIRNKVLMFRKAEEERARKEAEELQRKLEEEAKKQAEMGNKEVIPPPPVVAQTPPTTMTAKNGSATVRKVWDFEIEDEGAIPREYLIPDTTKIRQAIKDGVREIAGIRIFQKETIAVKNWGAVWETNAERGGDEK